MALSNRKSTFPAVFQSIQICFQLEIQSKEYRTQDSWIDCCPILTKSQLKKMVFKDHLRGVTNTLGILSSIFLLVRSLESYIDTSLAQGGFHWVQFHVIHLYFISSHHKRAIRNQNCVSICCKKWLKKKKSPCGCKNKQKVSKKVKHNSRFKKQ